MTGLVGTIIIGARAGRFAKFDDIEKQRHNEITFKAHNMP